MREFKKNHQLWISVLLVHYKKAKITWECIQSIFNTNYPNINIIIVDNSDSKKLEHQMTKCNNNKDYILEIVDEKTKELVFGRKIYLYKSKKNIGFGAAINKAAKFANMCNPDFLLIINNDTISSY